MCLVFVSDEKKRKKGRKIKTSMSNSSGYWYISFGRKHLGFSAHAMKETKLVPVYCWPITGRNCRTRLIARGELRWNSLLDLLPVCSKTS